MTRPTCLPRYFLAALLFCAMAFATDTLTMKDGTKHSGVFVGATARTITFKEGRTQRRTDGPPLFPHKR
jgi:hypothetical protein